MLRAGGNAVDAAVATSFALSVVRPYSCGVGGGGFMLVRLAGKAPVCINYRETAPAIMGAAYFEGNEDPLAATRSGKAVGVPGHVAGMLHALERFGTMERSRVLAPAIALAREGYEADAHYVSSAREAIGVVEGRAERIARFSFLWTRFLREGRVAIGDRIALPEQAELLERVARDGARAFYEGAVARAIVDAVHADGGELTLEDLGAYRVREHAPLATTFRGRTVLGMPPPSSGGIVLAQVLAMLEDRRELLEAALAEGHNAPGLIHLVAEACKHAFADRARWLGDPEQVRVPMEDLLSAARLAETAAKIDAGRTRERGFYGVLPAPRDDHGTSHLCVVDAMGGAVACTETINLEFGSFVGVPEFGFVLNDTIDDFVTRPGTANAFGLKHAGRNAPSAGKRPLSSMTPTMILEGGADSGVFMLAGASGGPRIISGTLQAILNVLLFDLGAEDAVARARFHHQWSPHTLQLEDGLVHTPTHDALVAKGHDVSRRQPVAAVQVIRRQAGGWEPASDPRKGGAPAGM